MNQINVGILNTPNQNPTIAPGTGTGNPLPWSNPSLVQYSLNYTFQHSVWATILQTTINRYQTLGDANADGYLDLIVFDCNGAYVYLNAYADKQFILINAANTVNGNLWNSEINFCDQTRSNAPKSAIDVNGDGLG